MAHTIITKQLLLFVFALVLNIVMPHECQGQVLLTSPPHRVIHEPVAYNTMRASIGTNLFNESFQTIMEAVQQDVYYVPGGWEQKTTEAASGTNVTAVVIGQVTNVQLLAFTALDATFTHYALWYVASVRLLEVKRGRFNSKTMLVLFNGSRGRVSYYCPYTPGSTHEYVLDGKTILSDRQVSSVPPYLAVNLQQWHEFIITHPTDAKWLSETWLTLFRSDVVSVFMESERYFVIVKAGKYVLLDPTINDYGNCERTIISLETRDVAEEEEFEAFCRNRNGKIRPIQLK